MTGPAPGTTLFAAADAVIVMVQVGYHASHEMLHPAELLRLVRRAEEAGFEGAMSSDHFHPWSRQQGHSGQSWPWLGAALHATRGPIGAVVAPGQRQHPALVAQAAATLAAMFPGRFWLALGSGEFLNEHVTGEPWPSKRARDERLLECVHVIRGLLRGDLVTYRGRHVQVDRARLWTLPPPRHRPALLAAALTPATASWAASWADGLITTGDAPAIRAAAQAFRAAAPGRPVFAQVQVGWGRTRREAEASAHRLWRFAALPYPLSEDLATPEDFDAATRRLGRAAVARRVLCSSDASEVARFLREVADAGVERIFVHGITKDQDGFLRFMGPVLRSLRHDDGGQGAEVRRQHRPRRQRQAARRGLASPQRPQRQQPRQAGGQQREGEAPLGLGKHGRTRGPRVDARQQGDLQQVRADDVGHREVGAPEPHRAPRAGQLRQ